MSFLKFVLILFYVSVVSSWTLNNTIELWSENVINKISETIETHFGKNYCLHTINDIYMKNLILKSIEKIPIFNIGIRKTKCRNLIIANKNVYNVRDILRNNSLPREARYLIFTSSQDSTSLLKETVVKEFYLDVKLCMVSRDEVTPPHQLGVVVGTSGRVDLRGRQLMIVGVRNPPFAVYEPTKKIKLNGVEVRVVRELADTLNFTWRVREPRDGQAWGSRNETGHWTGLKGELTNGDTDIGIALLYLSQEHYLSFQLSSPYTMVCITFLVPAPRRLLGHWDALLRPLQLSTWFTFLFIAAVHTVMLYIISRRSMNCCVLETIRGAALVSGPQPSGPISQRLLFTTWIIGCFLVAGLYGSELSAWMVAQVSEPQIRTLKDLARSNVMWGRRDSEIVIRLQQSPNAITRELIKKFQLESSNEDIEKKVLAGGYAIVVNVLSDGYPSGAEFLSPKARKKLIALQECVVPQYISIGMRRGLPLIQATSLELLRLQEGGLLQEWQARDVKTYGDQSDYKNLKISKDPELLPLDLSNLAGAFAFWILGHLLAMIVFAIEYLAARLKITYIKDI